MHNLLSLIKTLVKAAYVIVTSPPNAPDIPAPPPGNRPLSQPEREAYWKGWKDEATEEIEILDDEELRLFEALELDAGKILYADYTDRLPAPCGACPNCLRRQIETN